jgi:hypothetical protein
MKDRNAAHLPPHPGDPGHERITSTELCTHVSLEDLKEEDVTYCMTKIGCRDE